MAKKRTNSTNRKWINTTEKTKREIIKVAEETPDRRRPIKITNRAYAKLAQLAVTLNDLNLKALEKSPHLKAGYYSMSDAVEWAVDDALTHFENLGSLR